MEIKLNREEILAFMDAAARQTGNRFDPANR